MVLKKSQTLKYWLNFILVYLLLLPVGIIISMKAYNEFLRMEIGGQWAQQAAAYKELRYIFETTGSIPLELPDTIINKSSHIVKYDSRAWLHGDQILFVSCLKSSYLVTFGNGSVANLTLWRYGSSSQDNNVLSSIISEIGCNPLSNCIFLFIMPIYVITLICILIKKWQ
jgi:hypothetical protein